MIEYIKRHAIDLILILIISFIPVVWFPKDYLVTGHDAGYPINIFATYQDRLYAWNTLESLGRDNTINLGALPIHSIEAGFHAAGLSLYNAQKAAFVFWFFMILFSMHVFAYSIRHIIPLRTFPFIAAVLYGVNYYLLALWRYGAGTTFSAYIALPLSLTAFFAFFDRRLSLVSFGIWLSVIFFVFNGGGGFSLPLFGGTIISCMVVVLCYLLWEKPGSRLAYLARTVGAGIIFIILSLVLHGFWLFPFIHFVATNFSSEVASHGGISGVIAWTDAVSKYTSFANLFRLQGFPDWYEGLPHTYAPIILSQPLFIIASILFAPLAYVSLFIAREVKEKKILFVFAIISLAALFLSAGTHPPTGWLFAKLLEHVPGFAIFRSAQYKFVPALYISFSFLISYTVSVGIHNAYKMRILSKVPRSIGYFFICIVVGVTVLFYHFPYFDTGFFYYNKPLTTLLKVPGHVFAYDRWISEGVLGEDRVLLLPSLNGSWKSEAYRWNYFSLYSLFNLITPQAYLGYSQTMGESQFAFIRRMGIEALTGGQLFTRLSTLLMSHHALVRGDSYDDLSWIPSGPPEEYRSAMEQQGNQAIWENGPWSVFRLPRQENRGKFYTVDNPAQYIGPISQITAPFIYGVDHFFQTDTQELSQGGVNLADTGQGGVVAASQCSSCGLDEEMSPPEIGATVLPGSWLYRLKRWKERSLPKTSTDPGLRIPAILSLSMKRVAEVSQLASQGRNMSYITQNLEEVVTVWADIHGYMGGLAVGNADIRLMRFVDIYGRYEKRLLVQSYLDRNEKEVKEMIQKAVGEVDAALAAVVRHRSYWADTVDYPAFPISGSGSVFIDVLSLPKDVGGELILPQSIVVGGKSITLNPQKNGSIVVLGQFDLQSDDAVRLIFPTQDNYLVGETSRDVVGPNVQQTCRIFDVSGFDQTSQYRLELHSDHILPETARMFLKRKKIHITDASEVHTIDYLTKTDREITLDRFSTVPQYFSFSGEEGDIGAQIFFCAENLQEIREYPVRLSAYKRFTSPIYFAVNAEQNVATASAVSYRKIDQTRYEIDIPQSTNPTVLVFNENFHRDWRLYHASENADTGNATSPFDTFFLTSAVAEHFTMYGYANAWKLSPGSGGKYILEYYPQRLFYLGLVVSAVGVALVLVVLYFLKSRKAEGKQ